MIKSKKELLEESIQRIESAREIIYGLYEKAGYIGEVDEEFVEGSYFQGIIKDIFAVEFAFYQLLHMHVEIVISDSPLFGTNLVSANFVVDMQETRVIYLLYTTIFNKAASRIIRCKNNEDLPGCFRDIEHVCDKFVDICDEMIETIKRFQIN